MSAVEDRVARLESTVGSQGLELLRTRIELQLYKALIASRRWGSPGGNDKAIEALDLALFDLDRAALPAAFTDLRASLKADIIEYREGLRRMKVTSTATNQTRLYRTFDQFAAEVTELANSSRA